MDEAGMPVLGALPRYAPIALPERHLGLVQAEEHARLEEIIDDAAGLVSERVDLDAMYAVARSHEAPVGIPPSVRISPPGQRIALARDAAFSFVYPHLLELWRAAGSEVLPFSPLNDESPSEHATVCWLPGGYPELYAGRLAAANAFQRGLRSFATTRPVHGECGGYMAIGSGLVDSEGTRHEMAGLLGLETSFAARKLHLGYRTAKLLTPIPGYREGARLNGHEFHYASVLLQPDEALAVVCDATGQRVAETGSRRGNATGSFFHMIADGK
jgi:cobyrinic acid a,c-diamide synthase